MSNFTEKVRGLRSRRVQGIDHTQDEPTPFQVVGGWGTADDARSLPMDPSDSERAQRRAGAVALAALESERIERLRVAGDARLAGVRRGRDYDKGPGSE
jgi:hypothetical protein